MQPKHLSNDQLDKALATLVLNRHNVWMLACELLIRSGMRTHELTTVTPNNINSDKSLLFVKAAKDSRDHVVPVDRDCLDALEEALKKKQMPWQKMSVPSFKREMRRHWAEIRIQILGPGVGHCSTHGLRASFAVRLYQSAGKDILLVQELLGHKSIKSTMEYLRLVRGEERKAEILSAFK